MHTFKTRQHGPVGMVGDLAQQVAVRAQGLALAGSPPAHQHRQKTAEIGKIVCFSHQTQRTAKVGKNDGQVNIRF